LETILGPWIYDDETKDKRGFEMTNDKRDAAVRGLLDKARVNRGEQSETEKQRADAVAVLAGKQRTQKPLRPGVRELIDGGR